MNEHDPMVRYARIIKKNTADFTVGDLSKFFDWWIKQPKSKETIEAMKKMNAVKKVDVKKSVVKVEKKPVGKVVSKTVAKAVAVKSVVPKKNTHEKKSVVKAAMEEAKHEFVQQGAQTGRLSKKIVLVEMDKKQNQTIRKKVDAHVEEEEMETTELEIEETGEEEENGDAEYTDEEATEETEEIEEEETIVEEGEEEEIVGELGLNAQDVTALLWALHTIFENYDVSDSPEIETSLTGINEILKGVNDSIQENKG